MATFGETLKRERELRKITLREVSEATKIGLRYLEALEANRFDQLPGGLFNKGFIRAYAKFIGLDGEAMVNAYLFDLKSQDIPQSQRPRYAGFSLEEAAPPVPPAEKSPPSLLRRWAPAGIAGAAVLLLAAGIWLLVLRGESPSPGPAPSSPAVEERAQILPEPSVTPSGTGTAAPAEPVPRTQAPVPAAPGAGTVPPPPAAEETEEPSPPPEVLSLDLSVSETTWVALACDGTERLNREIEPAEGVLHFTCQGEFSLDSGSLGTMMLRINGNDCIPLGERGEVRHGIPIDRDRAAELCPPASEEN